ncbi:zinc finger protein 131-like isoform X2 [Artemia franciscana]|uniref:zinc finger protein 131-like isoform X2 n=1 Tax=Artemia franciscana TaxID=6661 RepID=UPI0032DA20EF
MKEKELHLRWDNYSAVYKGSFAALLNHEHFTDVTLSCDNQSIKCHRLVLSACSSYFENLLISNSHYQPIIILKDVKFCDLQALVKFMYIGEVTVAQTHFDSVLRLADMLKITGLADDRGPSPYVTDTSCPSQSTDASKPNVKRKKLDTDLDSSELIQDSSQDTSFVFIAHNATPSSDSCKSVPSPLLVNQKDLIAKDPLSFEDECIKTTTKEVAYKSSLLKEERRDHNNVKENGNSIDYASSINQRSKSHRQDSRGSHSFSDSCSRSEDGICEESSSLVIAEQELDLSTLANFVDSIGRKDKEDFRSIPHLSGKRQGRLLKPKAWLPNFFGSKTAFLKLWIWEHKDDPYPTEEEKRRFAKIANMTLAQVNQWFVNARRRRILQPDINTTTYLRTKYKEFYNP